MNRFKSLMYKLFYGRYGVDSYEYFLLVIYAILCLVNAIFRIQVIQSLTWLLFVYIIWRMMSRNHVKRSRENAVFTAIYSKFKIEAKLFRDKIRYSRDSRFRKCKYCHAIIKLPLKRGHHTVRCPKCGNRFEVKI